MPRRFSVAAIYLEHHSFRSRQAEGTRARLRAGGPSRPARRDSRAARGRRHRAPGPGRLTSRSTAVIAVFRLADLGGVAVENIAAVDAPSRGELRVPAGEEARVVFHQPQPQSPAPAALPALKWNHGGSASSVFRVTVKVSAPPREVSPQGPHRGRFSRAVDAEGHSAGAGRALGRRLEDLEIGAAVRTSRRRCRYRRCAPWSAFRRARTVFCRYGIGQHRRVALRR